MITKFVLNAILHHVGMSWIICSNNKVFYEIEGNNHPYWFNTVPWYNTAIYSKCHGQLFEDFIRHARTDRYHLMYSIISHNKNGPSYEDEESSLGDSPIPKNATIESLEALGDTLNFIDFWLKMFHHNYEVRWKMYKKDMKKLFKQIPTMKSKQLSQNKKHQKILTEIGGGWYM